MWPIYQKQGKKGNTDFIHRNELDNACFEHDMAYGKSKDLVKGTQSDKVFRDKAIKIANDPKYDGYQRELASIAYKLFDKKSSGSGVATEPTYQLANELHRQIIRKFKRRSKYNKGMKYLLCAIDTFSKYAWVVPLKDKRGINIAKAFQKIISKGRKPNKIWADEGGGFYNNLLKMFLKINNIEMHSTYNEGKFV